MNECYMGKERAAEDGGVKYVCTWFCIKKNMMCCSKYPSLSMLVSASCGVVNRLLYQCQNE